MIVYVLSKYGTPLMPTKRCGKVRKMLRNNEAKVVQIEPFTIQLLRDSNKYKQEIILGVDTGSKIIGLSASTTKEELFVSEVILRNDIVNLISTRRQYRKLKRRKLRYRKPRFLNRVKSKRKNWLPPSVQNKINSHVKIINKIYNILPISKIVVETAQFDIQKIKNPEIKGIQYQKGDQMGFWNVREYVLYRDNHKCQGQSNCLNKILQVHHLESRKIGGDRPDNLISICKECHKLLNNGKLNISVTKKRKGFRDSSFMNIMKWKLLETLKDLYLNVENTYGYITKYNRIRNNLKKSHINDSRCITGNFNSIPLNYFYLYKFIRKNNRKLHKSTILKCGIRKNNKLPNIVLGYRLFDKVNFNGVNCFIFGRRQRGSFDIRKLNGEIVNGNVNYKKIKLIRRSTNPLVDKVKEF